MNDDIRDPDAPSDAVWLPIRASLRAVAVPVDAREDAIAAALAEFDALQAVPAAAAAATAAAPVGNMVSLDERRQRRYRWLTSAAAAIVVLAGVGIVAGTIGRSSDDSTNVAGEPASATAAESADAAGSAAAGQFESAPKAAAEPGVMTAAAETLAPSGGGGVAATESTAAAAESTTPPTIGSIDGAASPGNTTPVDSPDQLVEYAATVPAASRQAPTNACLPPEVEVLGEVVYRQQQAIVVRAPTGQISAIDRLTCAVLVTVDP